MKTTLSLLVASLLCSTSLLAEPTLQWPGGAKAAVSLSYDDTLNSQLDNAVPQLDKYGFKGSFYLFVGSPVLKARMNEWRVIAANGHELGNHTLHHSCDASKSWNSWVQEWNDLNKRTVDEMGADTAIVSTFLEAIDGKSGPRTFTAPCGEHKASDGDYVKALEDRFVGIKVGISDQLVPVKDLNRLRMPLWTPFEIKANVLIDYVKRAAEMGTVANITFHGIGGDHMNIDTAEHEKLLKYLNDNRDIYWVDTYANIASHLKAAGH